MSEWIPAEGVTTRGAVRPEAVPLATFFVAQLPGLPRLGEIATADRLSFQAKQSNLPSSVLYCPVFFTAQCSLLPSVLYCPISRSGLNNFYFDRLLQSLSNIVSLLAAFFACRSSVLYCPISRYVVKSL